MFHVSGGCSMRAADSHTTKATANPQNYQQQRLICIRTEQHAFPSCMLYIPTWASPPVTQLLPFTQTNIRYEK
jgi:hypothetical protein